MEVLRDKATLSVRRSRASSREANNQAEYQIKHYARVKDDMDIMTSTCYLEVTEQQVSHNASFNRAAQPT